MSFPLDRGKFGVVLPCLWAFDGDALLFQDLSKLIQVLFRLFNDLLRKRATRNLGQRTVGEFRELSA